MKMEKRMMRIMVCALLFILLSAVSGSAAAPAEIINAQDSLIGIAEQIGNVDSFGDFCILQGGCVTQDYAWFAMLDKNTTLTYGLTESRIVKYDMKTMKEIARSEVMKLGHANDITYLEATNEICVIHVNRQLMSILDADSLELKEQKRIPVESYAVDYNPAKDRFVFAYGKAGMLFTDAQLSGKGYADTQDTTLVTQGICADDTYIYHVLWSTRTNEVEPDNIILVCDWEGNLVTRIPIGIKDYEPENISVVGEHFYIACNNLNDDGQAIFRVAIAKAE